MAYYYMAHNNVAEKYTLAWLLTIYHTMDSLMETIKPWHSHILFATLWHMAWLINAIYTMHILALT